MENKPDNENDLKQVDFENDPHLEKDPAHVDHAPCPKLPLADDMINDHVLSGWELHGFPNYSNLPYPEVQARLSDRMLSHEEILAVLKNAEVYRSRQSFYHTTKKWLLNREELEASTEWKNCTKNLKNIHVNGKLFLHEYTDATKNKYRYTLFSSSSNMEAGNSVHLVQIRPQKRKKPDSYEGIRESFFKFINEGIELLNNAKKSRRLTEAQAQALTNMAIEILMPGKSGDNFSKK